MTARLSTLSVRPSEPSDRAFIAALGSEALAPFIREPMGDWLDEPAVFTSIAERDGEPVGFLMDAVVPEGDRWAPGAALPTGPRYVEGLAVCVRPYDRGSGVGAVLLQVSIAFAQQVGADRIETNVADTNRSMRRLLDRLGFQPLPVAEDQYPGGAQAIRMCKSLSRCLEQLRSV